MPLYVAIPILDRLLAQQGAGNFAVITDLGLFISRVVGIVLILASILTFFYLAWGGLNWIMAGGDKGKVEEARNRITGAIIGLVIVAVSWALFLLINNFLGLGVAGGSAASTTTTNTLSSSGCSQGNCVSASRCTSGAVGSGAYCQNSLYTAQSFGSCGSGSVCCDCVVK